MGFITPLRTAPSAANSGAITPATGCFHFRKAGSQLARSAACSASMAGGIDLSKAPLNRSRWLVLSSSSNARLPAFRISVETTPSSNPW